MKKKSVRYIVIGAILLIVVLIILKKRGIIGSDRLTEVEVSEVTRHTITETVNASGKIQPEKEVKISADISGEIIELNVKEGEKVKKGQLLVRINPDQYQRSLEKAKAGVNSALAGVAQAKAAQAQSQANFLKAEQGYKRNKNLFDQKAISQADFEAIEAEFKVSKAQLAGAEESVQASKYNLSSAQASLKEAQDALNKTAVHAPIDGTISKLNVELGERVVGTMQMAGTEMMRIANLSNMQVEVDVNENDIVSLSEGDTALIEIDAFRKKIFKGIVTEIASSSESAGQSLEKVTNFTVKINILPDSYSDVDIRNKTLPTPFRPGMTANVTIQTKRVENVLSVPILAVTVRQASNPKDSVSNQDDEEVVFLFKDGKAVKQVIERGIQDDYYIQIKKGLTEGQKVISGPYSIVSKELKDGDQVKISSNLKTSNGR